MLYVHPSMSHGFFLLMIRVAVSTLVQMVGGMAHGALQVQVV